MMNNITRTLIAFLALYLAACSVSMPDEHSLSENSIDLMVASPFQDKMVLQRNKPINVWGSGQPNADVYVSINGNTVKTQVDVNGHWLTQLPPMKAGGPYKLNISANTQTLKFSNVLIGDVWYMGGQSNMTWPLKNANESKLLVEKLKSNENIRYLHVERQVAVDKQTHSKMSWKDKNSSNPNKWPAVASFFASELNAATDVPVGIIVSAFGSSSIEGWLPKELAADIPHFASRLEHYQSIKEEKANQTVSPVHNFQSNEKAIIEWSKIAANKLPAKKSIFLRTRPNALYNRMTHPLIPYSISGFVWYQGEANSTSKKDISRYPNTLSSLITTYRELFDQGELPFLVVQLPSISRKDLKLWPEFRLAQSSVSKQSNAHVVITVDTGATNKNIHPKEKAPIGKRLSLLARKYALNEQIVAEGPKVKSVNLVDGDLIITFNTESSLKTTNGRTPQMFEVANENGEFSAVKAKIISENQVQLSTAFISSPTKVRYAHHMLTKGIVNLTNSEGLPTAPFYISVDNAIR